MTKHNSIKEKLSNRRRKTDPRHPGYCYECHNVSRSEIEDLFAYDLRVANAYMSKIKLNSQLDHDL